MVFRGGNTVRTNTIHKSQEQKDVPTRTKKTMRKT